MKKMILFVGIFLYVSIAKAEQKNQMDGIRNSQRVSTTSGFRAMVKLGEVKILDIKGNEVDKLSLKPETKLSMKGLPLGENSKNIFKVKEETHKFAFTSESGKYIAICANTEIMSTFDEKGIEHIEMYERAGTGKVSLMDLNKKILWEYVLDEGIECIRSHDSIKVSDNGEVTVVSASDSLYRPNQTEEIIYAFNGKGKIILSIPSQETKHFVMSTLTGFSSNGVFLALSSTNLLKKYPDNTTTVFFNLKNKRYWDAGKRYGVFEISNEGIAKVSISGAHPIQYINLKGYIGE